MVSAEINGSLIDGFLNCPQPTNSSPQNHNGIQNAVSRRHARSANDYTQVTPIVLMLKSFAPCRHSPRQLMLIVYSTLKRSCAVACGGDMSSPTDFDVVGGARSMGKRACLHAAHAREPGGLRRHVHMGVTHLRCKLIRTA
jgi:hypothetical protein